MFAFQTTVHAMPPAARPGAIVELHGLKLQTLSVAADQLSTPFACTFEEARERLEQLERMYVEPDGSFVWASPHGEPSWQVDGNLYDRQERLLLVDLKGNCPEEQFDRLLTAFGWPATPLAFQLTREAVLLDGPEFRRLAEKVSGTKS